MIVNYEDFKLSLAKVSDVRVRKKIIQIVKNIEVRLPKRELYVQIEHYPKEIILYIWGNSRVRGHPVADFKNVATLKIGPNYIELMVGKELLLLDEDGS